MAKIIFMVFNVVVNMKIIPINPNLFQGKRPSFSTLVKLKRQGVENVFDLRANRAIDKIPEWKERFLCFILGLNYKKRSQNLGRSMNKDYFVKFADEIKSTKGKSFLHCTCGKHRANFAAQSVEIINSGKPVEKALEDINKTDYYNFKHSWLMKYKEWTGKLTPEHLHNRLEF